MGSRVGQTAFQAQVKFSQNEEDPLDVTARFRLLSDIEASVQRGATHLRAFLAKKYTAAKTESLKDTGLKTLGCCQKIRVENQCNHII